MPPVQSDIQGGGIIGFTALIYVEIKAVSSGESLRALLWVM